MKDDYATYLLNFFQKQNSVLVFDTTFRIASMSVNCKSYEELEKEALATDAFRLVFRTPTYLASLGSDFHLMFPDAVKVFCGLMRVWNLFSDGRRFGKEEYLLYKNWLTKNVGVSEYELWTRLALMKKKKGNRIRRLGHIRVKGRGKRMEQNNMYASEICRIRQCRRKQNRRIRSRTVCSTKV